MKDGTPELCFVSRSDFRDWLCENSETSGGVWLVFGKTKEVKTLTDDLPALREIVQDDQTMLAWNGAWTPGQRRMGYPAKSPDFVGRGGATQRASVRL